MTLAHGAATPVFSVDPAARGPAAPVGGAKAGAAASETAALTSRLARGDEPAWREFHAAYAGRLYRYLLVVVRGDETRAADALQATFVRAARHMREFAIEEVLWSWLTVLARSAATDEARRRSRFAGLLVRFREERTQEPVSGQDAGALPNLAEIVAAELAGLAEAERHVLTRKYLDGAPVREIASELETSEKAVESRLTRAREKLRGTVLRKLADPTP
jgi:RNA polymerase sigma-70 factor (ECF subfamily)